MARPISKSALIEYLATEADTSKRAASAFLDALAKTVTRRLIEGDAVALPGLVKFEPRDRPARQVHIAATGEKISKDADKAVGARVATALKSAVNA